MCRTLTVWWEDMDGNRIEGTERNFEPPAEFTPDYPTCTCYIEQADGDGKRLRETFVETVLRPMLVQPRIGRIVIEVF